MTAESRKRRPGQDAPPSISAAASIRPVDARNPEQGRALDIDAMVSDLDCALVVRVVISDAGQTRDLIFRSSEGAERALRRAEARGRQALVLLCRLQPVPLAAL